MLALFVAAALALSGWHDMTNTHAAVELFYSSDWNDAPAYTRDPISATWGLASEGEGLRPATATATLDNRSGDYLPDDARSDLYGLIGRNTAARVVLSPGFTTGTLKSTTDTFSRTAVSGWGTSDSGDAWTYYGSGGTVLASDFNVAAGVGTHAVTSANAIRGTYMAAIQASDVNVVVTITAPAASGAPISGGIVLRGTATDNMIVSRLFFNTDGSTQIATNAREGDLLDLYTVPGLTHTGQALRFRVQATGSRLLIKVWAAAGAEPDAWTRVVADNTEVPGTGWVGTYSRRSPGNLNSGVVSYDNWETSTQVPLAYGDVSSWEPGRAIKGDAWTGIEITGPSQRVNASKTVRSALRGSIDADGRPAAYWPMEGYATQPDVVASAVAGVPAAAHRAFSSTVTSPFNWEGDNTLPGSMNLPVLESNRTSLAGIEASVSIAPDPALGAGFWTRTAIPSTDNSHSINTQAIQTLALVAGGISYSLVLVTYPPGSSLAAVPDNGEVQVRVNQLTGTTLTQSVLVTGLPFVDGWRHVYARLVTSGSDVAVSISIDDDEVGTGTLTAVALGTVVKASMNAFTQDAAGEESGRISVGHAVVLADDVNSLESFGSLMYTAGLGYPGESCGDRFERLLDEYGIAATATGDDSPAMGPQYPDTLANQVAEIARTDGGMVYDAPRSGGMELRTGRSLYNQTPALELTYGVDVAAPLRPVTNDNGISNAVKANSRKGTQAHAERTSGPLNVSDPLDDPEGIGRIETAIDANPADDTTLPDIAGWRLHVGTWPGARYEELTVDLSANPELYVAALAVRPGDLITVDDLEADLVELLVIGGRYLVEGHHLKVTFTCIPAGPYRVGQVETAGFMRIGSSTSTLAADFDAGTDTSMSVAVTGSLWSTTAVPFHVKVGGAVLNVTAVSGASSPQTFTVDAATVNGVTRTIRTTDPASLTRVDVYPPIFVAL